jgi:hypothetical protein
VGYELRGQFLEACDCHVMCPCWFEQDPDQNSCTGVTGWYVDQGQINGVDVSGLVAVSVSYHGGHRHGAKARVALCIDERATDAQQQALADAFTGKLGGPLQELADMTDELSAVRREPITFTSDGASTELVVGTAVTASMRPLAGPTKRIITVADGGLATVLGTPAEVGESTRFRLDLEGEAFDVDLQGRSANRGRFAYLHQDQAQAGQ